MKDQYGRNIDYMRISVTDRCNLRCRYCMPDGVSLVPMSRILSYEEIETVAACAAALGVSKIKITGGEPLARLGCCALIANLKKIPGIEQVTMTTNGVLLEKYLPELTDAGLDGVNISLDTLNRERFLAITGRDELPAVLSSIRAVLKTPVRAKINVVLQKGMNDDEWTDLAEIAKDHPIMVRFIEMMPIGSGREVNGISNTDIRSGLKERYPDMTEDAEIHGNGPAVYVRIPGWQGGIGFISAMHGKFCADCNRIRLTSQGRLKPCLCYGETTDLFPILRGEGSEKMRAEQVKNALERAIYAKPLEHCFEKPENITEKGRMSGIGG